LLRRSLFRHRRPSFFSLACVAALRDLPSFPTRRSSDLKVIPGFFWFLGAGNPSLGITAAHHTPEFNIDEAALVPGVKLAANQLLDRKSTRLNSSHQIISYAVFCLKKKKNLTELTRHENQ